MRALGKYRLVEPLASGGMADVWRAEVAGVEGVVKEVALKLVRGDHDARSDFVRMFIEEARLASRLSHANVVQVFDFDQVDGRYLIAMELVRGRHLGQVVERCRSLGLRLGLPRAIHVCAEVAKGLAYAHRLAEGGRPLGIVHRDVSPHNVLVSFEGEVKLADFGIARAMNLSGLTEPGTLKGKLAYMAPEQARGEVVDARADVFSLGVVLWELLAGRRLFARGSEAASLAAVLGPDPISPPSAWNEAVPPELDAAVLAALEREPARRTASAQELATTLAGIVLRLVRTPEEFDLRALMQRLWPEEERAPAQPLEPTRVRTPSPAPVAPLPATPDEAAIAADRPEPLPDTAATRTALAVRRSVRRRRVAAVAAAAVVVAALALGGGWFARRWAGRAGRGDAAPARAGAARSAALPAGEGAAPPRVEAAGSGERARPVQAPGPAEPEHVAELAVEPAAADRAPAVPGPGASPSALATSPRSTNRLHGLALPAAASGEGLLSVNVTPWATLFVDGVRVGDTPREVRLSAGRHRVRVWHPRLGAAEADLVIVPGRRRTWFPQLGR